MADAPDGGCTVSIATLDPNLCITSVVSAPQAPRSSSTRVSMLDIELDPNVNLDVVNQSSTQDPPVACPPNLNQLPYPSPVPCARGPGLSAMPAQPTLAPTGPVVMNTLCQLRGQARNFDGGKLSFYGWGFDRASLSFGVACDPTQFFYNLAQKYMQYMSLILTPTSFDYPSLNLVSYSQLDLPVAQVKDRFKVERGLQEGVVLFIAVSASLFSLRNPDGESTSASRYPTTGSSMRRFHCRAASTGGSASFGAAGGSGSSSMPSARLVGVVTRSISCCS